MVCVAILDNEPDKLSEFINAEDKLQYAREIMEKYDVHIDKKAITLEYLCEQAIDCHKAVVLISAICDNTKWMKNKVQMINIVLNELLDDPELEAELSEACKDDTKTESLINEILDCLHEMRVKFKEYIDATLKDNKTESFFISMKIDDIFERILCLMSQINNAMLEDAVLNDVARETSA